MTGTLTVDPEIITAYPTWELEDEETEIRATGETYVAARRQLEAYVDEYDSYEAWLQAHGSLLEQATHSIEMNVEIIAQNFGGDY